MTLSEQRLVLRGKAMQKYLAERLNGLKGQDRKAFESEFKEWIGDESYSEYKVWSIPDLTDKGLRNFFLRAIDQIN